MIVEHLNMAHLEALELQDRQKRFAAFMCDEGYKRAMLPGAYAGICEGRVIGVAGLAHQWHGRAIAWSLLSPEIGHHFIELHRAVSRALRSVTINRIEAHIDPQYESAVRWITMLGFKREGTMKSFTPDGQDMDLYARVKNG